MSRILQFLSFSYESAAIVYHCQRSFLVHGCLQQHKPQTLTWLQHGSRTSKRSPAVTTWTTDIIIPSGGSADHVNFHGGSIQKMSHSLSRIACCRSESWERCGCVVCLGSGPERTPGCCTPPCPWHWPSGRYPGSITLIVQGTTGPLLTFPEEWRLQVEGQACGPSSITSLTGGDGTMTVPARQRRAPMPVSAGAALAPLSSTTARLCSVMKPPFQSIFPEDPSF